MTYPHSAPPVHTDNRQPRPQRRSLPHSRALKLALRHGPLTQARCEAAHLKAQASIEHGLPWSQRQAAALNPGEREHVHRVWVAMTRATWQDAFELLRLLGPTEG